MHVVVITDADQTDDHVVAVFGPYGRDDWDAAFAEAQRRIPQTDTGSLSYNFMPVTTTTQEGQS